MDKIQNNIDNIIYNAKSKNKLECEGGEYNISSLWNEKRKIAIYKAYLGFHRQYKNEETLSNFISHLKKIN